MNTEQPATSVPADTNSGLKARIKSVVIFLPFVLALLWFGGFGFAVALAALAAIAGFEWARMVTKGQSKPVPLSYLTAVICFVIALTAYLVPHPIAVFILTLSLCFLLFAACYAQGRQQSGLLCAGVIYIGMSMAAIEWLRDGSSQIGLYQVTTMIFMVWASDSFAYFFGRTIGGPKLAPSISPKKTWAGFIGSSIGAALVGYLLALPTVTGWLNVSSMNGFSSVEYAVLGAVLGMVGQAGDLLISYFKRKFKVKDTGGLIPGHGGVLDRIDALMLVALVFWGLTQVAS